MCKPNTTQVNAAAQQSADTSAQALAWYEQDVKDTQPQRDAAFTMDQNIGMEQLSGMQFAQQQAEDFADRNKTVYQPLEDKVVQQAQDYDTPEKRDAAAATARAGVAESLAAQQGATNRQLGRAGIAPGSMRSMAANNDLALQGGLGEAAASTAARNQVEATGHAMEMDAAGLGKGIVSNQATMEQLAQNGGTSAVGATGAGLSATYSAAPLMQTGFGQALQGSQIAGNLFGESAQIHYGQMGQMMQGVGGIMQGLGNSNALSSKKLKTDKRPVDDEAALAAVNKTPVGTWKYKPGIADSGEHIGPYAEDVQKTMGNGVAPAGKMVNLTAMQRINQQAIRKLTKELAGLNAKLAVLEERRR
jgi:hypothetical protein